MQSAFGRQNDGAQIQLKKKVKISWILGLQITMRITNDASFVTLMIVVIS